MARWKWVLLIFELVLFAVILVLPQVDLPDFTFHGGSAPVVVKSRLTSAPLRGATAMVTPILLPGNLTDRYVEAGIAARPSPSDYRLSLALRSALLARFSGP